MSMLVHEYTTVTLTRVSTAQTAALLEGVEDAIKAVARSRGLSGLNERNEWVAPAEGEDFAVVLSDYFDVCAGERERSFCLWKSRRMMHRRPCT